MKLLSYTQDDGYKYETFYSDVSNKTDEEIEDIILEIQKDYERPFSNARCKNFNITDVTNGLDLVNLVGYEKAVRLLKGIRGVLYKLEID